MTTGGGAELRLLRSMALVIAIGAVIFGWLAVAPVLLTAPFAPAWWSWTAFTLVFGAPVLAAGVVRFCDLRAARIVLGVTAGLYALVALSTFLAIGPVPWDRANWVFNNTTIATSAAALALGRSGAWSYNGIIAILVAISRIRLSDGGDILTGVQEGLFSFTLAALFITLAQLVSSQARRLDRESQASARNAAEVAAHAARRAERERIDALVHDTALATLMLASRSGAQLDPVLRRHAGEAADALARGTSPVEVTADTPYADLGELVRDRIRRIDQQIPLSDADSTSVPLPVGEALADAAAEAARNALRHAGDGVLPRVEVSTIGSGVVVTIHDDGVGFAVDEVPPARLGLRASVFGRLRRVRGASAEIRSAPGTGTTVLLRWEDPS